MLTNARARAAKPGEKRYEVCCEALPGFILRVLPTGRKVFYVRFRDGDGADRRHRLGIMGPGFGVEDARKEAMTMLVRRAPPERASARPAKPRAHALARPGDEEAVPVARVPTLAEFVRRFDSDHIAVYLKPSTAKMYRSAIRRQILPALGARRLDRIDASDVQRLHTSLKATPALANYVRCLVGIIFGRASRWGVFRGENPAKYVDRFRERAVERFLTPEERQRLEAVLSRAERLRHGQRGHVGQEGIWAIRLLTLTGMRRDEVRELRWEQVDWRQSLLRLPDSKTGKRDVVVSDGVMQILREIAAAKGNPRRGLVVSSCLGNKLYSLGDTWRTVRRLAELDDVRLHDLRHSVASDAIMNGVPLEVVGKMLGHRNYRTTQRYAHIADSVLREAVNLTSETIRRAQQNGRDEGRRPSRKRPGG